MAVKSQINVAVDDAAFVEFKAAFDKYSKAISDLPTVWAGVEKSTAKTRTNFEATAISVGVLGSSIASVTARGKEFYQVTTATARHWKDLALSTHNVARNIIATTESLLKWTGIVSLITGGAGLWGFDRLAGNVANQRSAAFGTGGGRAGRIAFTTNFRRLGDPEGLLGRVAGMQADLKQSVPLRMLGISPDDIRNLPPEEVAMKALQRGAQIASTTRVPVGSDPRLAAFSTPERIWLRDHRAEIEGMIAETRQEKTAGRFRLKPEEEKAAQDFETKMDRAGKAIETSFVKGLVKLAGPLGELSDSVVKLVASFTEKALPDIVKDLGDAIEWLAKEVDQPSFVSKVEGLVSTIGSLASAFGGILGGLARFARWLGVASPGATINQAHVQTSSPSSGGGGGTGSGYGVHGQSRDQFLTGPARNRGGTGSVSSAATGGQATTSTGGGHARGGESAEVVAYIRQAAIARGIDPDVAVAAARSEGLRGFDPSSGHWSSGSNDSGTSFGPYQLHYASNIPGQRSAGLGDEFDRSTGLSGRDIHNWRAATDYALDTAARKHSWRDWHGMNRHPSNEGLERAHRVVIQSAPGGNTSLGSGAAAAGSP